MIIKSAGTLKGITRAGEATIYHHEQDNTPVLAQCYAERQDYDGMFKRDRAALKIASIPALQFKKFMDRDGHSVDWKALYRWLNSDEGRRFKTTR